jgi:hypothetical protein
VLPDGGRDLEWRNRAARFLAGGVRTLEVLGVPAETAMRVGAVQYEILQEMENGKQDLLVVGAPLPDREGKVSLDGIVGHLLDGAIRHPILIVRSSKDRDRGLGSGDRGRTKQRQLASFSI